jgi:hypothetical protein
MSMMKPVDNHTTSMGMMEIIGSRTGRFTRNDSVQPISVASTWNGGDAETMLPLALEQVTVVQHAMLSPAMSAAAGHGTA